MLEVGAGRGAVLRDGSVVFWPENELGPHPSPDSPVSCFFGVSRAVVFRICEKGVECFLSCEKGVECFLSCGKGVECFRSFGNADFDL